MSSDARPRTTLLLIWAILATFLALLSTGVAVFFALQARKPHDELGWIRWETSAGGNGHRYKAVATVEILSWKQADKLARTMGGHLATISSQAENDFVFGLVNAPEFFGKHGEGPALGGTQQEGAAEPGGGWSWVNGEPWSYSNWFSTEPNNGRYQDGTEDRLQFYSARSQTPAATWNDAHHNDHKMPGFVMERTD